MFDNYTYICYYDCIYFFKSLHLVHKLPVVYPTCRHKNSPYLPIPRNVSTEVKHVLVQSTFKLTINASRLCAFNSFIKCGMSKMFMSTCIGIPSVDI